MPIEDIHTRLSQWSERKSKLFDDAHISSAQLHINKYLLA